MKVIAVDDEPWMMKRFLMECEKIEDIDAKGFLDAQEAVEYVKHNDVQAAFLDICMPQMTGFELATALRAARPGIVLIYLSAHEHYMPDAFRNQEADYFLLKPYTTESLKQSIDRARRLCTRQKKRIYVETFGNFNVYVDDQIVEFKSKNAKEILALLVDRRGTALSSKDMFYTMFEDLPYTHENMARIRKGLLKLRETLQENGISDLLVSSRHDHYVDVTKFDCDAYKLFDGDPEMAGLYRGEYMSEYEWADPTNALIYEKVRGRA